MLCKLLSDTENPHTLIYLQKYTSLQSYEGVDHAKDMFYYLKNIRFVLVPEIQSFYNRQNKDNISLTQVHTKLQYVKKKKLYQGKSYLLGS